MTGQIVLITGSNGGIGASMVESFTTAGATVIGADRSDVGRQSTLSGYHSLDVTDESAVALAISRIVSTHGRIDALVHAAGVLGETPDPMRTSTAEFERIMSINTTGTFTIVRETGQAMLDTGTKGTILLFSSVAAKEARRAYLPYNASKIAVLHIMWSMAQILGPSGISVNAITPGPVETAMWAQLADASGDDADAADRARAERAAQLPMQRFARPEEVANAALFLADPRNRYITGVSLDVAGGAHLGMGS
ncbi:SDR family oxidoreductase (plasmid) [Herbiconiux sp. KACC 21604]|uniref:SDR family NAD(P)-dependent oxidoreductase n=1 Tax=unclassified Herbiconiux TaxID=2618217 RepID=UPI0020A59E57|nr:MULTISPECIES: SDR family oxidoreductase [unclassified Herbiconiux]WPO88834.1 SDR family oxidoreductase [Herbiconiux sp. KACC 21604]